ncbi:MAG: bifunctional proline dehydrogenase/L-glutamate gamma-semialdehyde dehydrogenase PutA, partial [Hyphomicrobiaceae bacterium]|nr:bifunctional proline dehydrogenase/L-glutamate gamma-semialdehyde dehydrogenase PutA [Hyphomicrobiaceae bacterium]
VYKQIPAEAADLGSAMRGLVQRLGEPVVRTAVAQAMKLLGQQFVLGSTIEDALANARADRARARVLHSFDMLGEAARTDADARRYFAAYAHAIAAIGKQATAADPHANSGISVKLSALHPRYEALKPARVREELVPRIADLARMARDANIALAIDAEEADRLDISLDVIEALLADNTLDGWAGLGIVVQAYARRTPTLIDWLDAASRRYGRKFSVRLVKGAYWDAEIKLGQLTGTPSYPVYTRKEHTDIAYLACARKLLAAADRIYPQFATHNAHTAVAIEAMARDLLPAGTTYEFQRLHGMGAPLHETLQKSDGRLRRIYAPVGIHRDLLAYLVRRLLENGANSSFVNQIVDETVAPETIAADPVAKARAHGFTPHPSIPTPAAIYGASANSRGWNVFDTAERAQLVAQVEPFLARRDAGNGPAVTNPAIRSDRVGTRNDGDAAAARDAVSTALAGFAGWSGRSGAERGTILARAADLYEANTGELIALAIREAGKSWGDAVAELREAVDFLRYYAGEAGELPGSARARGVIVAISPWNFPLAIFTGQIAGALAAGNTVVAKPAEQTPLIARLGARLMHEAGVPADALVFIEGDGAAVGATLTGDPRIAGTVFTGSNETARLIDIAMAEKGNPDAILVAETGGLNAMIVDSTALLEQATRDILASAFQSAGQRCSALRLLCVQEDVAAPLIEMLKGAMDELAIGDPTEFATDVGPVIDEEARAGILAHCEKLETEGRLLHKLTLPGATFDGTFVAPAMFRLDAVADLRKEIFGPVLHVVTFRARDLDRVVDAINATGYGLTFGMHSRIDGRVDHVCARIHAGNVYVNRNMIGAVVGVQPFGGEGLSGTGPKAGGPHYVARFATERVRTTDITASGGNTALLSLDAPDEGAG